ncbi:MAG: Smr/MutS family protein [Candidatus Lambdaproteobacteria bacterium]|nr:Smr/MutS family protein [Candidatus Lambdaproteobacteria bacterium]
MSRRRLHGETQKRRKKKATQALKRQQQVERVAATHVPAAFERSPEIATHDIAFLEAMREMGVRHQPGRPVSPLRQEAAEGLHIRLEQADQDLFHARMASLDVQPLGHGPRRNSSHPAAEPRARADATPNAGDPDPEADAVPGQDGRQAAPGAPDGASASGQKARRDGARRVDDGMSRQVGAAGGWALQPQAPREPPDTLPPRHPARPPAARPPAIQPAPAPGDAFTVFEEHAADADLMSAALGDAGSPVERKYEGAPPPPIPRRRTAERTPDQPDAELDLHGKSLDQALHMVQNFLLTAFRQGLRHVLLVTGKGLNSGEGGPVLRDAVVRWLEHDGRLVVESFHWAPPLHGGSGAVWVVLRDWRAGQGPTPPRD